MLVSHRFSTVRNADRIHVLEAGRLIESGTHEELVALGGQYAQMYAIQARAFADRRVDGGEGGIRTPEPGRPD